MALNKVIDPFSPSNKCYLKWKTLPTTHRLPLPTTYHVTDHTPTTFTDHIPCYRPHYRPHTDHLYRPRTNSSTCSLLPSPSDKMLVLNVCTIPRSNTALVGARPWSTRIRTKSAMCGMLASHTCWDQHGNSGYTHKGWYHKEKAQFHYSVTHLQYCLSHSHGFHMQSSIVWTRYDMHCIESVKWAQVQKVHSPKFYGEI